jgi:type II secretory pathway pseudopilin PulG
MNSNSNRASTSAFTLVALLVIIGVIAVLAAMLLPALAGAQRKAQRINCVNNLKQCGLAFRIWEGDNDDKYPMDVPAAKGGTMGFDTGADTFRHFQVMSNELSTPKILICPSDTRTAAANFIRFNNQNISYFVALDANEAEPQRFLSGDRNITADNPPVNGILKLVPGQPVSWTETIHVNQGNIGLSDGSVQQCSDTMLQTFLQTSGSPTNTWRISLPE